MRSFLLFLFLLTSLAWAHGQSMEELSAIKLKDLKNKSASINVNDKHVVIMFLGSDCPITQKYIARVKDIVKDFEPTTDFYGVFPTQFSLKEIKTFKKEYDIDFTFLSDDKMELAKHLGATVTPEVFLINKNNHLQYQGAIDNWFYELGKSRLNTTENYLIDALTAVGKGDTPTIKKTEAIGCFIQMPHKMMDHQNHP